MSQKSRKLLYLFALVGLVLVGRYLYPQPPLQPAAGPGGAYQARVVAVHDGDTLTVLDAAQTRHKIRMAQIDAPELSQPYGQAAKQALSGLVYGRVVSVQPHATDRYSRTVATVVVSGTDINRTLVKTGAAWAYLDYLNDSTLATDQAAAQTAHKGLWALQADQRTPPWEYRAHQRDGER